MKLLAALPALLVVLVAPAASADDILLHDGKDITGVRIEREAYDKVEYKKGSGPVQSVDTSAVREVRYGRTNADFSKGLQFLDEGEMAQAAAAFLDAEADENLETYKRATALAEAGDALLANNNLAEAQAAFTRLESAYAGSRHLARAILGRGKALLYSGKLAEAAQAFDKLLQEAGSKKLGDRWMLEAEFFKLFAAEAQGKDVASGYADLRTRAQGAFRGIANRCALRMGRVHQANGRADQAQALFDEIIASRLETDDDVVAEAYTGRGRVHFDRGLAALRAGKPDSPQQALEHFRAARLDLLRVYVSYKGVYRQQPEALYWAGQAFLNVAALDPSEKDAQVWGQRLLLRCRDGFPQTEWGMKAAASP